MSNEEKQNSDYALDIGIQEYNSGKTGVVRAWMKNSRILSW